MEKAVINVEGMSCGHCVKAVESAVTALPGIAVVNVDLLGKTVSVEYDPAKCTLDTIMSEIDEQGFEVLR